ncbi:aminoglycoside N(3)-acetyltransferase [Consotaella aegiceratis]|uniref:aminoglycoside N(3)-acetyltransferase n=1 Tax=Consotaella aegiceratis TaxID=3097961 RepID=UPI002F3F23AF
MPDRLRRQLIDLGLQASDIVMVHASLRAFGRGHGTADDLIQAILDAIAPDGAMMMYAGCESPFDEIGRGRWSLDEEKRILRNCPAFDPATARACPDHGALAELFRRYPGTVCSHHVGWRMAANGDRAAWLTDDHPLNYGAGAGSPLHKLVQAGGKVLLIGSDRDAVTLLHHAEDMTAVPDKKTVHIKVPLAIDGRREWLEIEENNSSTGIRDWPDRFFASIVEGFARRYAAPSGRVGAAEALLLDARLLVGYAMAVMEVEAAKLDLAKSERSA